MDINIGDRIKADWLPRGSFIVQKIFPGDDHTSLVLINERTGKQEFREPTKDEMQRIEIIKHLDSDGLAKCGNSHMFKLTIEAMRLGFAYSYDPYFALSVSRVDPLPHQLEAVYMHMIKQPRIRFLLGDDAGAGKTIMAGLLIRELGLRGLADRVLILSPANLRYQWRRELKDLFGERFELIIPHDVSDSYASNPWMKDDKCIVSRDWAKIDRVMESLEEADKWDLVVIDEAHGMATSNPEKNPTQRFRLAKMISKHTDHLLMMTATPHNGDKNRFLHFLSLLDDDVYSDPKSLELAIKNKSAPFYLRRLKESMRHFPTEEYPQGKPIFTKRTVNTVPFDIDGEEYKLYQDLTNYLRYIGQIARKYQGPRAFAIGFMMALYQRRFASSPHALLKSLERRQNRLEQIRDGTWVPPKKKKRIIDEDRISDLDDETLESEYEEEEDVQISEYDKAQAVEELQYLLPLIVKTNKLVDAGSTAKWEKLETMLDSGEAFNTESDRKLLIFTEHKDTLEWLDKKISEKGFKTVIIHGGMKPGSRDNPNTRLWAEQQFREEDGAQILIATEAAGEGINLQFCWRMVNWDVPWNPARLEQRIGRIHRYKQKRSVIAFNLIAVNTREGAVLETLQEKIEEIRRALDPDNEGKVFDVVGSAIPPNMIEKVLKQVYEEKLTKEEAMEFVREEMSEEKFENIINHTLESLASRELNLGIVKKYNAEAKVRRLVPEVLRDFFILSAEKVFEQPVKPNGLDYTWKTPKAILDMRKDLRYLGDLGKEYKAFTFHKKSLEERPALEWVTPGHPLYEGVRRYTLNRGEKHLAAGARFYDPDGGPERWVQIFRYKMVDGNGIPVDEQLLMIEVANISGEYKISFQAPTLFLDFVPDDFSTDPIPDITESNMSARIHAYAREYLSGENGVSKKHSAERREKADIVRQHVTTSLNALIQKENMKFQSYEREQDRKLCQLRVEGYEERLVRREEELIKQGEVIIQQIIPIALAYVKPLPDDYLEQVEELKGKEITAAQLTRNPAVEKAAVDYVIQWEKAHGAAKIVSRELEKGYGYDLESYDEHDNLIKFIEVKGKSTEHDGILTPGEWSAAERLREDYWLYVVEDPINNPQLRRIRDPFIKIKPVPEIKVQRLFFKMDEIREKAETENRSEV